MESDTQLISLEEQISVLPTKPGIYKYYNSENRLIYVGKAKNLKKRVSSYFNKNQLDNKTRSLVKQIQRIEFIVVNTETDALLLENNLIKTYQPKYNILLKDDKSYPYIVLTKERFPKVYTTRRYNKDKGEYFGPFASVGAMNTVLELIKKTFTIRNCDLNLSKTNIENKKYKKCLEYHLGNCKAPCEGLQTEMEYLTELEQVKEILNGDLTKVKKYFNNLMKNEAEAFNFENAQKIKQKIEQLEKYQSNSLVYNTDQKNQFVCTYKSINDNCYINLIKILYGRIVQSKTLQFKKILNETDEELFTSALLQIANELDIKNQLILTNIKADLESIEIKTTIPKQGQKKGLIDLSLKNIDYYIKSQYQTETNTDNENRILLQLQQDLMLKELPTHIECFDNSNLQGTTPVAAMVCFKNGKPSKKDWRHFNIKTVVGANDFASMEEIIFRRYSRLIEENQPLPNLVIIDGGKGQLAFAYKSLQKLNLNGKIPIISIAKRLEEIYTPNDELPLLLNKKSESLQFLTRVRDEVHRFGITFHRKKRDKTPKIKKGK